MLEVLELSFMVPMNLEVKVRGFRVLWSNSVESTDFLGALIFWNRGSRE